MPSTSVAGPSMPVRPGFVAMYMAAQVGAYIAFIPLLTLILPLKVEAIDPVARTQILSEVAFWGALTAGIASVLAGLIGDRTRHWPGGRSVWIVAGLVGTVVSYGFIHAAATQADLLTAIVMLQVSLNFMLNPLTATLSERIPAHQRGMVAGFIGLAYPISNLFGALAIGMWLTSEALRLTTVVVVTVVMVIPFVVTTLRAAPMSQAMRQRGPSLTALADRDFLIAFASRLLVQTAVALNVLYLLFFLDKQTDFQTVLPGVRIEAAFGGLLAISTVLAVIAGLVGGRVCDRIGRRRVLVSGGATVVAMGALLMGLAPSWPGPLIAQAVLGLGIGLYGITDAVLIAEVIPDPANAGRDLGLLNVAVTAAQMLAPLVGLIALTSFEGDLRSVYLVGALFAFIGGSGVLWIRRVR